MSVTQIQNQKNIFRTQVNTRIFKTEAASYISHMSTGTTARLLLLQCTLYRTEGTQAQTTYNTEYYVHFHSNIQCIITL
jgi:hypothetical protein